MAVGTYRRTGEHVAVPQRSGVSLDYNSAGLEFTCRQMAKITDDKGLRCDLLLLAGRIEESSQEFPEAPVAVPIEALRTPEAFFGYMQTFYKRSS